MNFRWKGGKQASESPRRLRVAFVAGTLEPDGAEKQLVYMVEALQRVPVEVCVYSLTQGEFHEATLAAAGLTPVWVGRFKSPLLRVVVLSHALRQFRPDIVQAGHFFTNIYAALAAWFCGAISIGAIRGDPIAAQRTHGRWFSWLLRLPSGLIANSAAAAQRVKSFRTSPTTVHILPNVIDVADFDSRVGSGGRSSRDCSCLISVGRLVPEKRVDRFLEALAEARQRRPSVHGVILGSGPLKSALECRAAALGLLPDGVCFTGQRADVPALLDGSGVFVLTSDHEGFPNVLLEAMAARLPVVTTPAGDAADLVEDGRTGFVVDFGDKKKLVERIERLTDSPDLRRELGEAGRKRVEEVYGCAGVASRLLGIYRKVALERGKRHLASRIETLADSEDALGGVGTRGLEK